MARTISVAQPSPDRTDDLDGTVVDGIEALRQRIVEAIRFRFGTWMLARNAGLDYGLLIGHQITADLAASTLNEVIRKEGGDEVTRLDNVVYSLDRPSRYFYYAVLVQTVYGPMQISETSP